METKASDANEDSISAIKVMRRQLESRLDTLHTAQLDLIASLRTVVPDIVSSLDLSIKTIATFNNKPFTPLEKILPSETNFFKSHVHKLPLENLKLPSSISASKASTKENERSLIEERGDPLSVVRSMIAVCLLERVPFSPIGSPTLLRKLENDSSSTETEKMALWELGGESGSVHAVESALRSMAEDNGGVEFDEFVVSGKSRVMVMNIDRTRLLKELPETKRNSNDENRVSEAMKSVEIVSGGLGFGMGRGISDMWIEAPVMMDSRGGGPRGMGMIGVPRGVGVPPPMQRQLPMTPNVLHGGGSNAFALKPRTEEDVMKDLEALLNKKSFKETEKSTTGEQLLDLIHRPTARETAAAAKFKSNGGSQVKEYCYALTKEDCRRQSGSFIACEKVHFRRIIASHTDVNLGDCSFLDTCRHMKTCMFTMSWTQLLMYHP